VERPRRVVIFATLPPPLTGASKNTAIIASAIGELSPAMAIIDVSPNNLKRGPQYHFRRLSRTLVGCVRIILFGRGPETVYISAEANYGLLYSAIAVVCARLRRSIIFIHHHSFYYVNQRSRMMSAVKRVSGQDAHHVFLCETMQRGFVQQYGAVQGSVVSNLAMLSEPIGRGARPPSGTPIRVGLLSNLTLDKGVREFLEVVDECASLAVDVNAVLAGPADSDVRALLESRSSGSYAPISWIGPVYDEQKSAFFDSLDIFLFPTTYAVEAQPNVVLEAAAHGLLIIATDIGCISEDIARLGGHSLPHSSFVPSAVNIISRVYDDREGAWEEGANRMESVRALREIAIGKYAKLIASVAK
jgi:glycosyltransferase involved in cell wall biosynthesis